MFSRSFIFSDWIQVHQNKIMFRGVEEFLNEELNFNETYHLVVYQ